MKSRKKKTEADAAESPEKKHGGKRAGAGRKPASGKAMKAGIYIRCSAAQKGALEEFVEDLSARRVAEGLPKVDLSTWIRELALKHSGNEDLGLAAAARRAAEAAASIV